MTMNINPELLKLPGDWAARGGLDQFEPTDAHYQAAGEWIYRLRDCDAQTTEAFERWKEAHPGHAFAFAELQTIFSAGGDAARDVNRNGPSAGLPRRSHGWRYFAVGIAACLALALLVPLLPMLGYLGADVTSGAGEVRAVRLADGSRITLNSKSALDTEISANGRNVRLRGGEAYFEVAKDPSRPFTVQAGHALVRVLGTKFNIRIDDELTTISVTEGRVWVMSNTHAEQALVLTAGQQALVDNSNMRPQTARLDVVNSWRGRKLFFAETPMRLVVKELNRYRTMPLILTDRSLGNLKVTGVFSTSDSNEAVRNFERIVGTSSVTVPPGYTFLY
jgi:transmembrane sensor